MMDRHAPKDGPQRPDAFKAIATTYRGFNFRSRLEAKYACFFDLCKWSWSYEPKDFNGWIPDFALGELARLVEIKPFFHDEEWTDAKKKVMDSGCKESVILIGADPVWAANNRERDCGGGAVFAGLFSPLDVDEYNDWGTWDLHFGLCEGNQMPGLCPMSGAWHNEIWKLGGKDARVWLSEDQADKLLVRNWATACNISQWVPLAK